MTDNPVGWFEIHVDDIARARAFYESVLGVTLQRLNSPGIEMWAFPSDMQRTGASGSLIKVDGFPAGGNSTRVYFSCEDCAVEAARVDPSGGRLHRGKISIGEYGFCALAFDSEGNLFGLHSLR